MKQTTTTNNSKVQRKSIGFWRESWREFRKRKLAMISFIFILILGTISIFTPFIVGAKPIVVKYEGQYYFPVMGYYNRSWENTIFNGTPFFKRYNKQAMQKRDPESWTIEPIVFQDPFSRIRKKDYPYLEDNPTDKNGFPSSTNLFGTNQIGIDVFAQVLFGIKTAMLVGFVSMGIASTIGIIVGAIAGFYGGIYDIILSRIIELVMCIPSLILILTVVAIIPNPNIWYTMMVLGFIGWTRIARLTRAEFMKIRTMEFVDAARALGVSQFKIMFRHILPNALSPVLVPIIFGVASAILIESSLSFLGLGDPNSPSWGQILQDGKRNLKMWWLIVFPGAAIFLTVMAYNIIGEGMQEAMDPKHRQGKK